MLIKIVNHGAAHQLLSLIEESDKHNAVRGALYFQSSKLSLKPTEEEILLSVRPVLEGKSSTVYFFEDCDIVIVWSGTQKTILETLCSRLYESLGSIERNLHKYYDLQANANDLRSLCKQKINAPSAIAPKNAVEKSEDQAVFKPPSQEQVRVFREGLYSRGYRVQPEILIVEDQPFSSSLLLSLLARTHKTHVAADAKKAWNLYLEHAPDIVFLDIELPEVNGHQLAGELHKLDPQAFIVMVTGNNYAKDVNSTLR